MRGFTEKLRRHGWPGFGEAKLSVNASQVQKYGLIVRVGSGRGLVYVTEMNHYLEDISAPLWVLTMLAGPGAGDSVCTGLKLVGRLQHPGFDS